MPIFDQGYQHWEGKLSGHAWRWLAITRQGVRSGLKNRWARMLMLFSMVPALVLAGFLIVWGLAEQSVNQGVVQMLGFLPPAIRQAPRDFRVPIWTLAYQYYFQMQMLFCMLLVVIVGPSLISQDLRFNAIPLYFSRPLRRFDYFLGKLGVIGVFLGAVAVVPAVVAYLLGVSFSLDLSVVKDTIRLLGASILYGLVVVLSAGMLMLAISSLSRNSRYVGAAWIGLWLISGTVSGILMVHLRADWCPAVSYVGNLTRVGEVLLGSDSAQKKISDSMRALADGAGGTHRRPAPPGGRGNPPPPGPIPDERDGNVMPRAPWYLSAGVLAGLFGLSIWTLTFRVKSLDRLR
jgi:ABC-2 type transport system permease protein